MPSPETTTPNPYFSDRNFTLFLGDSLEIMNQLSPKSINMAFCDPPYFLGKAAWDKSQGFKKDYDFHLRWLTACRRLLKDDGCVWISGISESIFQCGYALQELGFKILNTITWFKPDVAVNRTKRYFTACDEHLIWAAKSPRSRHTFNYALMKNWRKNLRHKLGCTHCGKLSEHELFHKTGMEMRNVWAIWSTPSWEKTHGKHPTQKPLDLLLRVVLSNTKNGHRILDPFCGTGTTGIVAAKYGRHFIGIDQEKRYLDIAIRRYQHLQSNLFSSKTNTQERVKP